MTGLRFVRLTRFGRMRVTADHTFVSLGQGPAEDQRGTNGRESDQQISPKDSSAGQARGISQPC